MTWQVKIRMPSGGTRIADVLDSDATHITVQLNDHMDPQRVHRSHIINEEDE